MTALASGAKHDTTSINVDGDNSSRFMKAQSYHLPQVPSALVPTKQKKIASRFALIAGIVELSFMLRERGKKNSSNSNNKTSQTAQRKALLLIRKWMERWNRKKNTASPSWTAKKKHNRKANVAQWEGEALRNKVCSRMPGGDGRRFKRVVSKYNKEIIMHLSGGGGGEVRRKAEG